MTESTPNDRNTTLPPQNLEAEQSVLGSLLLDRDAIIQVADIITREDFYKENNGVIFEAMLELYERREPIDVLSVTNRLQETKQLDRVGGSSYLATLAGAVPSAAHVEHYARIVQGKSTLRKLIAAGNEITRLGFQEAEKVDNILDVAQQRIYAVSQSQMKQNFTTIKSVLADTFERIAELHDNDGTLLGLPTGYTQLDNLLAGLQKSDLIILAARPSMGKTTFALDIARSVATSAKQPVGIFSLEMSKEQLVSRLLASTAGVDLWKLRTGKLSDADFDKLNAAIGVLSEAPLYIDDTPGATINEIRTKARRLQSEKGVSLLVIDYLQLMSGSHTASDNRVQEVSEISRSLKGIARELNVPVISLSQLSRAVESRTPQIPQLSDLRESGSIEQDADVVMFIYREGVYDPESPRKNIADILVKKHRNGPTGKVELYFDENLVSFKNLDSGHKPPTSDYSPSSSPVHTSDITISGFGE
jgi:replicative DNA helicase